MPCRLTLYRHVVHTFALDLPPPPAADPTPFPIPDAAVLVLLRWESEAPEKKGKVEWFRISSLGTVKPRDCFSIQAGRQAGVLIRVIAGLATKSNICGGAFLWFSPWQSSVNKLHAHKYMLNENERMNDETPYYRPYNGWPNGYSFRGEEAANDCADDSENI